MKFGLYLPPFGELADPWALSDLAVRAEDRQFDGVFVWDHILRSQPRLAVADPWVALAAVAVRTERIALGALVTPLTRRRPQKFARETVTLDHLSRGRLVVGVGLGVDSAGELSRFGEEVDERARADRLDEALVLVKELWTGETVVHRGAHFEADGVMFVPRPVRGSIPVWVAARVPVAGAMLRAAGCDGIYPLASPEVLSEMLGKIREQRGSLDNFDVVVRGGPGTEPGPWRERGATWWLVDVEPGVPIAEIEAIIDAGPPAAGASG